MHQPKEKGTQAQNKKTKDIKTEVVASYLYAVIIRVENRLLLLATGPPREEAVHCVNRLQTCRSNSVASDGQSKLATPRR